VRVKEQGTINKNVGCAVAARLPVYTLAGEFSCRCRHSLGVARVFKIDLDNPCWWSG